MVQLHVDSCSKSVDELFILSLASPCLFVYAICCIRAGLGNIVESMQTSSLCKVMPSTTLKDPDFRGINYIKSKVTDVFLDFHGTLTVGTPQAHDYLLPLLDKCRGLRVTDVVDPAFSDGLITWEQLDKKMASHVNDVQLDMSDSSLFGATVVQNMLGESLRGSVQHGIRLHLLTMRTPQTHKALLKAAGYDVSLFQSWLGLSIWSEIRVYNISLTTGTATV